MAITKEMIFGNYKKSNENIKTEENMVWLDMDKMIEFREPQPFPMHSGIKEKQMKESIERFGILTPIIVRKIEDDKYEIIEGRNRVKLSKELGNKKAPSIIKDVDDDVARLIMLETNIYQRDDIPPVVKGMAYKMQLETLKKIREKGGTPLEHQKSIENLANNTEESRATIQRLIRLTELIEPLQDKVNMGEQISIRAGVELSYISKEEQEIVNKVIEENNLKISIEQAEEIRAIKGTITEQSIVEIFTPKPKEKQIKFTGKIGKDTLKKYKEKFNSNDEFDELVNKLLEEYFNKSEVTSL